jgi:hypothetical protein
MQFGNRIRSYFENEVLLSIGLLYHSRQIPGGPLKRTGDMAFAGNLLGQLRVSAPQNRQAYATLI